MTKSPSIPADGHVWPAFQQMDIYGQHSSRWTCMGFPETGPNSIFIQSLNRWWSKYMSKHFTNTQSKQAYIFNACCFYNELIR